MKSNLVRLHTLFAAGILLFTSCNNRNSNSGQNMADSAAAKVDTAVQDIKQGAQTAVNDVKNALNSNPDSNFVVKAATSNNAELKILQAGIDNGTNKELKAHARMMLADHRKLGEKVKDYSAKKGYVLPDGDNGKSYDEMARLNGLTKGVDWDNEWVGHMVSAHQDAIDMFENAKTAIKDDDLRTIITDALLTLHSHMDMMKQLQDKMGK